MIILVPLYNYLNEISDTKEIAKYILFGAPLSAIFWSTMVLFGIQKRRIFLLLLSFTCFFFIFPLAWLQLLTNAEIMSSYNKYVIYVLVA